MTVEQLIDKLRELPPKAEVYQSNDDYYSEGWYSSDNVELDEDNRVKIESYYEYKVRNAKAESEG